MDGWMDVWMDGWMEKELLEDESRDGVHLRSPGARAAFPVLSFPFQGFLARPCICLRASLSGCVGVWG